MMIHWKRSKRYLVIPLLMAVALIIAACGSDDDEIAAPQATLTTGSVATAQPTATAEVEPPVADDKRGGELIRGTSRVHRFWDYNTDAVWFAPQTMQRIYSNLVRFDPSDGNTIIGDLATDWSISSDAKTFTFTLREGVKWHDGQPLTADDVVFTFERAKNPPEGLVFPRLSAMKLLESIVADGNTVTFKLSDPDVDFLQNFAGAWGIILPRHVVEQEGGLNGPDRIVGTGPFVMGDQELDSFITTNANPDFYVMAPDGKPFPYLDSITTVSLPDPEARIAAQQTGRVDISSYDPAEFQNAVGAFKSIGEANVQMQISALAGVNYLGLNASKPPFDDLNVRRALYLLFDRLRMQELSRLPSGENATIPAGFLGTVDPFLDEIPTLPEVARDTRDAALAEGKALAEAAGFNSFTLTLQSTPPFFQEIAQLAAQVLEDAGIDVTLRVLDRTANAEARTTGDFEAAMGTPNVVLPSVSAFFREQYLPGGREPLIAEPPEEFNTVFAQIAATLDGPEREQQIRDALKIMREDWVPVVPFDKQRGSVELIANYVHGRAPATGQWFNLHWYVDLWVDDDSPRK